MPASTLVPLDVIIDILSRLPVTSVLGFRCMRVKIISFSDRRSRFHQPPPQAIHRNQLQPQPHSFSFHLWGEQDLLFKPGFT
ncbi:hypothetical protein AB3S75_035511 [Citrus x aurantiifolia]